METCKAVEWMDSASVGREGSVMPAKNSVFKLDMVDVGLWRRRNGPIANDRPAPGYGESGM